MITDPSVLEPAFVPRDVQYRDAQINHLTRALEPVTRGHAAETAFLLGPSGTGKTCLGKFALERLERAEHPCDTQYVNCWRDYTRYRVLYRALEGLGRAVDVHRQSTPQDVLLERLHDREGPRYVVVLDEVDQLEDPGVLYDLYRAPTVDMVLIANEAEPFVRRLDARLRSRLRGATRIRFDRYGLDALVAILQDRVRWGLEPSSVDRTHLERIADAAAGDARFAIQILRTAALAAERDGRTGLDPADVADAVADASRAIRQKDREQLKPHQRVLVEIVEEAGAIAPGELYERYSDRVDDPRTRRMVRNYLRKCCQYNLLEAAGEGPTRQYAPVDGADADRRDADAADADRGDADERRGSDAPDADATTPSP